jgi:type I restriction enzyme R subunit
LIDFNNPDNNDFLAVNQFTLIQGHHNKRPDLVIFLNGIPLVVVELKNPNDEDATLEKAYNQLQTYKELISDLFVYNELLIISDGIDAKVGSISSHYNRFSPWKINDGITLASNLQSGLEVMIQGMLNKKTLLDLIQNFIVF